MEQLKAGVGRVNITPPPGVYLAGYRLRDKPAWRIQDELRATALVVEAQGKRAVLICADLVGLPLRRVEAVRADISRQTGISPDGVMISCSHTHSGPQTRERPHLILGTGGGWIKQTHDAYLKTLEEKLAGAAVMACNGLEPAGIGAGRGELRGCVINRRCPDGVTDPQDILYERQIACFYSDLAVEAWGPIIGLKYAEEVLQFVQEREKDPGHRVIQTEVQAVSIGDTACVGIPGELFVEIGLAIKRASPFSRTIVFGYSNDSVGYLPTREAFPAGGYGVTWASRVTEEAEGQICVASSKALERCRAEQG